MSCDLDSDLEYKIIDQTATESVCELLIGSFFKEEPLGIALSVPTTEVSRWLPSYIGSILAEPVSLGAFSDGVLVGVCVNAMENHPSLIESVNQEEEPTMYEIARFLHILNEGLDVEAELNLEPGSRVLTTLFLNVDSSFGGKGIATKLALKSEDMARDLGAVAVQVDTTSEFSYKVYSKLSYQVLRQMDYSDLKCEMTGCQVIKNRNIGAIHRCGRALAKILSPGEASG